MGESSGHIENAEMTQYPPVRVIYEGNPFSPPIRIDGKLVSQAIKENNYPSSVVKPIVVTNSGESMDVAHFNALTNKLVLNQRELVDFFKTVRKREYEYLDSTKMNPGRLKKFLSSAGYLLNPITAPPPAAC